MKYFRFLSQFCIKVTALFLRIKLKILDINYFFLQKVCTITTFEIS